MMTKPTSFNFGHNEDEQGSLFSEPKKESPPLPPVDDKPPVIQSLETAEQVSLIEKGEWWENDWKGMPEFVSKDLMPFKTIYVHFESREQMEKFAALVNQNITLETQSIWYPELEVQDLLQKRYVDTK